MACNAKHKGRLLQRVEKSALRGKPLTVKPVRE